MKHDHVYACVIFRHSVEPLSTTFSQHTFSMTAGNGRDRRINLKLKSTQMKVAKSVMDKDAGTVWCVGNKEVNEICMYTEHVGFCSDFSFWNPLAWAVNKIAKIVYVITMIRLCC